MQFSGMPQRPKPPARIVAPSGMSRTASIALVQHLVHARSSPFLRALAGRSGELPKWGGDARASRFVRAPAQGASAVFGSDLGPGPPAALPGRLLDASLSSRRSSRWASRSSPRRPSPRPLRGQRTASPRARPRGAPTLAEPPAAAATSGGESRARPRARAPRSGARSARAHEPAEHADSVGFPNEGHLRAASGSTRPGPIRVVPQYVTPDSAGACLRSSR